MDPIATFEHLMQGGRFSEALPVIEDIVHRSPNVGTSWFNLGCCLDANARYADAAVAFQRSYSIDTYDKGIQFRIFRSFALAQDARGFTAFAEQEVKTTPRLLDLLRDSPEFTEVLSHKWFQFRMRNMPSVPGEA